MSLSSDQLADRAHAIPASDFPAIMGLSPFKSPLDVWLEHTGKSAPFAGNDRTRWGDILEQPIRADYESRRGVRVEQCGTLLSTIDGVTIAATPDGIVYPHPDVRDRGLEIKTHSIYAADYGADGTDEVPVHVALQCQIGMMVARLGRWDVVAFWDGLPHDYSLRYDEQLASQATEFCARWWRDHVVAHRAPSPDGSKATEQTVRRMFPGRWCDLKQATWLTPTDAQLELVGVLRSLRRESAIARTLEKTARQRLEMIIGEHDGLEWHENGKPVRLSWRRSRDSCETDYKAALADYHAAIALVLNGEHAADVVHDVRALIERGPDLERFTTTKPGSRRFTCPRAWAKDLPPGEDESE